MSGNVQFGPGGDPSWAPPEEPGFFSQLMQQGVLGMPVSEAMLRFGSGLLSGNNWQQGLSQGGSSLVEGAQSGRRLQQQIALNERQFAQNQALQNQRLAQQERLQNARGALTPFQRGGQVFRDPNTGTHYESVFDARTGATALQPVGGGTPLTGQDLATVQPRLVRAAQEVTSGLNELQQASARRYDEILNEGSRATSTIRDIDTILATATDPETGRPRIATGQSIPATVVRGLSQFLGINVNGTTPERLDILQNYLGNLNATQRADLLRGLQPISNAEFQSADQALVTLRTDPNAMVTLLQLQRTAAQRQAQLAADLGKENIDDLVRRGAVRSWEFDWRQRQSNPDLSRPRVEDTGNNQPPRLQTTDGRGANVPRYNLEPGGDTNPASNPGAPQQPAPPPRRPAPQGPPAPSGFVPGDTAIDAPPPPAPPPPRPGFNSVEPQRSDFPPGWQGDVAHWNAMRRWRTENPNSRFPGTTR